MVKNAGPGLKAPGQLEGRFKGRSCSPLAVREKVLSRLFPYDEVRLSVLHEQ